MVELELVGLSEDGTRVVLADAEGDEFAVPLDGRLRAVVRGGRARTGQWETPMETAQAESTLRPRDIQARIRAGESPEAVAEIAQVPVDRIMGYAVPVMAERQHIAERAQRSAVRRKNADGPGMVLWDAVAERLRARNVDPGSARWDAWRRDDGRWTVTVRFSADAGEETGTFVFDALSRYAVPHDDDGRRLVGERPEQPEQAGRPGRDAPRRPAGRRLTAVASEYDAMLFDDEPTADLTAVADVLAREADPASDPASGPVPDHTRSAPPADPAADTSGLVRAPAPGDTGTGTGTGTGTETGTETGTGDGAHDETAGEAASRTRQQQPKPERRRSRGRGRASVPSWDEIMFGQPKG